MKRLILLICLFLTGGLWAHEGHTHAVTEGESYLWLKEKLQLPTQSYRIVRTEIVAFKKSKSSTAAHYKDSIIAETKKKSPNVTKIRQWSTQMGEAADSEMLYFATHLIALRKVLNEKQIDVILRNYKRIYESKKHKHSHKHTDGKVHTHDHGHDGDHKHDHGEKHKHSHKHVDGKVHTHDHGHEGDHKHHHGTEKHKHSHTHKDGKTHTHVHEEHSGDHTHYHEGEIHKHSHKHANGKVHTHDHNHGEDHKHTH